jgi:hypothetical protein
MTEADEAIKQARRDAFASSFARRVRIELGRQGLSLNVLPVGSKDRDFEKVLGPNYKERADREFDVVIRALFPKLESMLQCVPDWRGKDATNVPELAYVIWQGLGQPERLGRLFEETYSYYIPCARSSFPGPHVEHTSGTSPQNRFPDTWDLNPYTSWIRMPEIQELLKKPKQLARTEGRLEELKLRAEMRRRQKIVNKQVEAEIKKIEKTEIRARSERALQEYIAKRLEELIASKSSSLGDIESDRIATISDITAIISPAEHSTLRNMINKAASGFDEKAPKTQQLIHGFLTELVADVVIAEQQEWKDELSERLFHNPAANFDTLMARQRASLLINQVKQNKAEQGKMNRHDFYPYVEHAAFLLVRKEIEKTKMAELEVELDKVGQPKLLPHEIERLVQEEEERLEIELLGTCLVHPFRDASALLASFGKKAERIPEALQGAGGVLPEFLGVVDLLGNLIARFDKAKENPFGLRLHELRFRLSYWPTATPAEKLGMLHDLAKLCGATGSMRATQSESIRNGGDAVCAEYVIQDCKKTIEIMADSEWGKALYDNGLVDWYFRLVGFDFEKIGSPIAGVRLDTKFLRPLWALCHDDKEKTSGLTGQAKAFQAYCQEKNQ